MFLPCSGCGAELSPQVCPALLRRRAYLLVSGTEHADAKVSIAVTLLHGIKTAATRLSKVPQQRLIHDASCHTQESYGIL